MAKYIKSYSKYVKETTHQKTSDGRILQRDWTTVGGTDTFTTTQPIAYRSNNFIITVSEPSSLSYDSSTETWTKSEDGSDIWSLENTTSSATVDDISEHSVIDNSYKDLRDYAYYGSCQEMIRASINDALKRFPGEMYVTNEKIPFFNGSVYTDFSYNGNALVTISNPFGVDISTSSINISETSDSLKYFANLGYEEYEVIESSGETYDISGWTVTPQSGNCIFYYNNIFTGNAMDGNAHVVSGNNDSVSGMGTDFLSFTLEQVYFNSDYTAFKSVSGGEYSYQNTIYVDVSRKYFGSNDGTVPIQPNIVMTSFMVLDEISIALSGGGNMLVYYIAGGTNYSNKFYASTSDYIDWHIRPKNRTDVVDGEIIDRRYYDNFIESLDSFQKVILNTRTDPKYTSRFNIIYETDNGFVTRQESFQFPINVGDYNIGNSTSFDNYVIKLMKIGELYDEYFSDNLYRMMTHETIKNFDWAFSREKETDEGSEYVSSTTRIANVIRIFGREFDEIKQRIDTMSNGGNVSYDGLDNVPDYFLTDLLLYNGWDVKNIYPYVYSGGTLCQPTSSNEKYYPYENGYKNLYNSSIEYNLEDINNAFFKRLLLNSKSIRRAGGTINGIEKIMGLFGLKSERWVQAHNNQYAHIDSSFSSIPHHTSAVSDYEIKEYSTFMYPLFDEYNSADGLCTHDYYNQAKLISYSNENAMNGVYESYRGLPVEYDEVSIISGGNTISGNMLYPYFNPSPDYPYDGGLYYQMNGGWFNITPFDFTNDDEIMDVDGLFTETSRKILSVNSITDLLQISPNDVMNGTIAHVKKLEPNKVVLNGTVYDILYDENGKRYVSLEVEANQIFIGDMSFDGTVTVMGEFGSVSVIDLTIMDDGTEVRTYIFKNDGYDEFYFYNDSSSVYSVTFTNDIITDTGYFILQNIDGIQEFGDFGWKPLKSTDMDYKKTKRISNYFNGNNPHNGNCKYDNGFGYLSNFYTLFKYPYNNDLFDLTAFENDYYTMENEIGNFGFRRLIGDNENNCDYTYYEVEDGKIHSFAYETGTDGKNKENNGIASEPSYSAFTGSKLKTFSAFTATEVEFIKNYIVPLWKDFKNNEKQTDSIVNTKRVDIIIKSGLYANKEHLDNTKYLLSIINNYLKQMIPSNIICNFKFGE